MSGGSMNYLYSKVLHCADFPLDTPEREAFAKHLKLVAQALHDIEWVDSGDYGPGDENAAIRACLRPEQPKAEPNVEYERGFIDGMQKQAQSSVDRAVNRMAEPERHFCERCGKRLSQDGVHTCTPPQQAEPVEPGAWVGDPSTQDYASTVPDTQIADRLARHGIPKP
jgi:hypothetical protein